MWCVLATRKKFMIHDVVPRLWLQPLRKCPFNVDENSAGTLGGLEHLECPKCLNASSDLWLLDSWDAGAARRDLEHQPCCEGSADSSQHFWKHSAKKLKLVSSVQEWYVGMSHYVPTFVAIMAGRQHTPRKRRFKDAVASIVAQFLFSRVLYMNSFGIAMPCNVHFATRRSPVLSILNAMIRLTFFWNWWGHMGTWSMQNGWHWDVQSERQDGTSFCYS